MEEFTLQRAAIMVTRRCNLKCRLCAAYIPYYPEKLRCDFDLNSLIASVDKLFLIVDYMNIFTITGGETLLYKPLPLLIEHIIKYEQKVKKIEIITNGTIVPSRDLLVLLSKHPNISVLVDNYGSNLSVKTAEIAQVFKDYGIKHIIRNNNMDLAHCNGWVDFGDHTKKLESYEDCVALYKKCAHPQKLGFCFTCIDGKMFPCAKARRLHELKIIPDIKNEYINLMSSDTVMEQRKKFQHIQSLPFLSACAYCNGMCEDSVRFVPAEQLKPGEPYESR